MTAPTPLAGLRVIEFTHMVMGPTVGHILAGLGADVVASRPAEFAAVLKADIARWARVVKESGAKVE